MIWLLNQQVHHLQQDQQRGPEEKLWPRLHEHSFKMNHADWTKPDLLHFAKYTFQILYDLREREARFIEEQQSAQAPPAQKQRHDSAIVPLRAAARTLPLPAAAARFTLSQASSGTSSASAAIHAQFRSHVPVAESKKKKKEKQSTMAPTNQLVHSSLPFGTVKPMAVSHARLALASSSAAAANSGPKQTTLLPQPIPSSALGASSAAPINLTTTASTLEIAPQSIAPFLPLWKELMLFYEKQVVQPDSDALEVRASEHVAQPWNKPCELGVFATRRIPKNQRVCYYAAHKVTDAEVNRRLDSHVRHLPNTSSSLDGLPIARLFRRYIARSDADVAELLAKTAADFSPVPGTIEATRLAGLRSSIGCMINSPVAAQEGQQKATANVRIEYLSVSAADGLDLAAIQCLTTKCDVEAGAELLCAYGSPEEKRKFAPRAEKRLFAQLA